MTASYPHAHHRGNPDVEAQGLCTESNTKPLCLVAGNSYVGKLRTQRYLTFNILRITVVGGALCPRCQRCLAKDAAAAWHAVHNDVLSGGVILDSQGIS